MFAPRLLWRHAALQERQSNVVLLATPLHSKTKTCKCLDSLGTTTLTPINLDDVPTQLSISIVIPLREGSLTAPAEFAKIIALSPRIFRTCATNAERQDQYFPCPASGQHGCPRRRWLLTVLSRHTACSSGVSGRPSPSKSHSHVNALPLRSQNELLS